MNDPSMPSPRQALVPIPAADAGTSYPILHVSNQVVLYNPTSHALTIHPSKTTLSQPRRTAPRNVCPYCSRPFPSDSEPDLDDEYADFELDSDLDRFEDVSPNARAADYFQLLQVANESASRPITPPIIRGSGILGGGEGSGENSGSNDGAFRPDAMADGYFKAFFQEEAKLGMGANGSVYLCQHVLNGNPLGHFAVKKIAVGQSSSYLLKILREVKLLETLRHPNIITYHHAWLENAQFSSFGLKVPTLHVLMQWAEGGSLDDYIDARLGKSTSLHGPTTGSPTSSSPPSFSDGPGHSRSARIRAFRAMQHAAPEDKERMRERLGMTATGKDGKGKVSWKAVHLLSAEEVLGLFRGVVEGLAFLHDRSILHLDLKPGNVLLTWDEGKLIPRAMLSDFGTSRDMINSSGARTGNTGTLEYTSPESLPSPPLFTIPPIDSKADIWSLGMILHKLLFFRLPYKWASDGEGVRDISRGAEDGHSVMDRLENEVRAYNGFKPNASIDTLFKSRHLPRAYLVLLENLLNTSTAVRPSCERILQGLHSGMFDPIPRASNSSSTSSSLVTVPAPKRATPPTSPPVLEPLVTSEPGHRPVPTRSHVSDVDPDTTPTSEKTPLQWEEEHGAPLGLPDPSSEPSSFSEAVWQSLGESKPSLVRVLKSAVFALKIASLFDSGNIPRPPQPLIVYLLVTLGIVDTLSDSLWKLLFLGLAHLLVLRACILWADMCKA